MTGKIRKNYKLIDLISKNKHSEIYYRKALGKEYKKFLEALFKELEKKGLKNGKLEQKEVDKIFKEFRGKKFIIFERNTDKILKKYVNLLSYRNKMTITEKKEVLKEALTINYDKKLYEPYLRDFIKDNTLLIKKDLEIETINRIEEAVYKSMAGGEGEYGIIKELKEIQKTNELMTDSRIKLIARDQSAKANQAMNMISQKAAGIEYFEWETAHDERVSKGKGGHKQLQGKIFKYGDTEDRLPIIDSYENHGLPAQRPNCRCTGLGVIVRGEYKVEYLGKNEGYKIIGNRFR
ncbi:MAG: phage head morphogenesis protein [Elusimicrobiota bacterium]|jgi:SPP1 gp7 family putative phage head morphogenesis protein|nr:phage head morphogenesis protein [Elusimicrobiota bacterium]